MNKKLLTIIIPTFNSGRYIGKTLDHLVAQTYKDFSVWIIDDNSKDDTRKIIRQFQAKLRIDFIRKPPNIAKGGASTLNFAFKNLKTPLWAIIDSDARLSKNWVATVLQLLKTEQLVGGPMLATKEGGVIGYLVGLEVEGRYLSIKKKHVSHLCNCNLAGRTKIIKSITLFEDLHYGYDHHFSFLMNEKGYSFLLIPKIYCFHVNKTTIGGYFMQQFFIAKYHSLLAKRMPKRAIKGSEVSPIYLLVQPFCLAFSMIFIFLNYKISLIFFLFFILANYRYYALVIKRISWALPIAVFLSILKIFAWSSGILSSLTLRNRESRNKSIL